MNVLGSATPTSIRLQLFDGGWQPIPVTAPGTCKDGGKKPVLANWQSIALSPPIIRSWATGPRRRDTNTGIRTRGLVAVDIDVLDEALSGRIMEMSTSMLGRTSLVRIGKAPKRLTVYRAAADVGKALTPKFVLDGTGLEVQVECLGDGQQFVAFGTHPGTGQPYRWIAESPLDIAVADLPVVNAVQVRDFLQAAEAEIRASGGHTKKELAGVAKNPTRKTKAAAPRHGDWPAPTRGDVESALATIPNHHDWQGWFKIGAAIFDALGEAGQEVFGAWSAQSSKNDAAATAEKYQSFSRSSSTVTAASLFYEARENGWLSDRELERGRRQDSGPVPPAMDEVPLSAYEAEARGAPVDDDEVTRLLTEFNGRYAVVNEAGKAVVYEAGHDQMLNRDHFIRIEFGDLRKLYLNRKVTVGIGENGEPIMRPAADVWLAHADRRQYIGGVVFDPACKRVRPDTLNLWRGYAIQPKQGSWKLLQGHIFRVLCAGNEGHRDYLMGWMARLVQYPAQQGEVAVVMRGGEGTGKGTLAKILLRILGQHGLAISNSKHLAGSFNGHLRDAVFLFADEAFFAGDRAHVGVLKSLITEPYLTIEAKFQNAVQMANFVHLMMASNEEWVVPASLDARRFFVLEVLASRANDHAYFGAIWQEMQTGGYEAMLYDLLQYDLTFFNVRRVPTTEGLQQQRKLSLGTSEAWWMDCLHRGYVYRSRLGLESYFSEWQEEVTTEVLFASYSDYAKAHNERRPVEREALGRFLVQVGCKAYKPRNAVIGEHIADVEIVQGIIRKPALVRKARATGYALGSLSEARAAFSTATKLKPEWPPQEGDL